MKIKLITVFIFGTLVCKAQLNVTTNNSANALAQKIVGQGITILNATFRGDRLSAGVFNDFTGLLGIDSGIILTTGRAATIGSGITNNNKGANAEAGGSRTSKINNQPGDPDLQSYANINTKDACILEFDFIPKGDSINVKYVFASDEYQGVSGQQGYICGNENDAFAFFISGPGITGQQNIALVPGTNIPVAINTINNGDVRPPNSNNNYTSLTICSAYGSGSPFTNFYNDNRAGRDLSYNGFTTVLKAQAKVIPCQTYRIKLVIADGSDDIFDSGVFIEASSFSSNAISISNSGGFVDTQNNTSVVEGCKNSQVKLKLNSPASVNTTLQLNYSGTATFGVDYAPLPNSILFAIGEQEKNLDIVPIIDNLTEGNETIVISIGGNSCTNVSTISTSVTIKDSIGFYLSKDTFVCSKFPSIIKAQKVDTAINKYNWNTNDTSQQIAITTPGTYWVVHTFSNRCFNIDTFKVSNGDPTVNIGGNISFCNKDSVLVNAVVNPTGGNFLWSNTSTNASTYISSSGKFLLQYTALNGCYLSDSLLSTVKPLPYPNLGNDTSLCSYENINLNAFYPNATYVWSTGETTATINVKDSALYIVENTLNGCKVIDSIVVGRKITGVANAGNDLAILAGGTARLKAITSPNNKEYLWMPSTYINTPNQSNTNASPPVTSSIILKVTSPDNCISYDTVIVEVKDIELDIPNAFSPNGDQYNQTWEIKLLSSYLFARVQVFNRAGQLVYNSIGYDNPWDGTLNGKPLPVGTYYYIIEPGFGRKLRKGSVTIIR